MDRREGEEGLPVAMAATAAPVDLRVVTVAQEVTVVPWQRIPR